MNEFACRSYGSCKKIWKISMRWKVRDFYGSRSESKRKSSLKNNKSYFRIVLVKGRVYVLEMEKR